MNKRIIMLMAAVLALLSASGQVGFIGYGQYAPIDTTLSYNHSSLNKVFVVYDTNGVGMTYTAKTDELVRWKDFNDEPIPCVIHEGRIVERGTHDSLLAIDGYYKKLHDMQKV